MSFEADQLALTGYQPDGPRQSFLPACNEFSPCSPGAITSPTGSIFVLAVGSATIDGIEYGLTQYFGGPQNAFTFSAGDVVVPGGMPDFFSLHTPFTAN